MEGEGHDGLSWQTTSDWRAHVTVVWQTVLVRSRVPARWGQAMGNDRFQVSVDMVGEGWIELIGRITYSAPG
jgi:hypothetical protein